MNKSSDMLFRLVSSLTQKEAADFRRSQTTYQVAKGKNNFILLFDALRELPNFEDALLKKKLPKGFNYSNLSSLKTQLKTRLLDFLVSNNESRFSVAHRKIEEIEVLFSRGFYPEAYDLVKEAKKHLHQVNLTSYIFPVTYYESYLTNYLGGKEILNSIRSISMENERIAESIYRTHRMATLISRVYAIQTKGTILRKKEDVEELFILIALGNKELKEPGLTTGHELTLHQALLRLYISSCDFAKAFHHAQALFPLYKKIYDALKGSDSERLFSIITDMLGAAYPAKEVGAYTSWFQEFQKNLSSLPQSPMYLDFHAIFAYQGGSFSENVSTKKQAFANLLSHYHHPGFTHVPARKTAEEEIALEYISRKDFESAAHYLYILIEPAQTTDINLEQYDFLRVVRLVMLFELFQSKKLSEESYRAQVNTVYQRIRKMPKSEDYRLENAVLKFLRRDTRVMNKKGQRSALEELRKQILQLIKDVPLYMKQAKTHFDFLQWAEGYLKA